MWPWVLGSAALGGLTGGIGAYQQSGGDLGATLRGVATGGLLGGATGAIGKGVGEKAARMAGSALGLGGTALGKTLTSKAATGTLTGPEKLLFNAPRLAGGLAGTGAALVGGGLLSPVAEAATNLAGQALGGTARAAGAATGAVGKGAGLYRAATFQPSELVQPTYQSIAVPEGMAQPTGLIEQQNLVGAWQGNLQYQRQLQDLVNQNTMRLANYNVKLSDEVKRRDLLRDAAAAKLKTDLATTSALMLGGQQIAGAQASQALADIGATARTQYQYL